MAAVIELAFRLLSIAKVLGFARMDIRSDQPPAYLQSFPFDPA
jgi:hypothetical protein